jgi:hypothetical protein
MIKNTQNLKKYYIKDVSNYHLGIYSLNTARALEIATIEKE